MARYDTIGIKYNKYRKADNRIVFVLKDLLGLPEGSTIIDVGAGTGNYSNEFSMLGYKIKAIEPSKAMREQANPMPNVEWFSGSSESIPLENSSVDGLISTLTVHHFSDLSAAAMEMWRVCGDSSMILLTIDPRIGEPFWFHKYFPGIYKQLLDAFIPVEKLISIFTLNFSAHASVHKFPLPSDLTDMNMHAGWNRPEIYFDYEVRRGISPFALADEAEVQNGLDQLWSDLKSGRWDKKYGYLRKKASYDLGFIFVKFVRTISPSGIAKARRLSHANIASS